jgi:hypothetical protein
MLIRTLLYVSFKHILIRAFATVTLKNRIPNVEIRGQLHTEYMVEEAKKYLLNID